VLDALDPAYAGRVADAGGLPLIASRPPGSVPGGTPALAAELLDLADGLLVSGGGDVDPVSYGAAPENVEDADPEADAWELALLRGARERDLPTLAICRGAQLLAVAHGGRLSQHLPPVLGHAELAQMTPGRDPHGAPSRRRRPRVAAGPRARRRAAPAPPREHHPPPRHRRSRGPGRHRHRRGRGHRGRRAAGPWPAVGVQWHPEKMEDPCSAPSSPSSSITPASARGGRMSPPAAAPRLHRAAVARRPREPRPAAALALLGRLHDRRVPHGSRRGRRAPAQGARARRRPRRGRGDLRRLAVLLGRPARARRPDPGPVPRVLPRGRAPSTRASPSRAASTSGSTRTSRCTAAGSRASRRSSARST
jgi:putative glutamine amidotransferase